MNKSIAISIACFLFIGLFAFLIWGTVSFFKNEYNAEQSYNDGYTAGAVDKAELQNQITSLTVDKTNLTSKIETLTADIADKENAINQYKADKTQLENEKTALETENEQNELEITQLTTLKNELQSRLDNALADSTTDKATISSLQSQLATVNAQLTALNTANSQNIATIANLNSQIISLNNNITELTADMLEQSNELATANAKLTKLTSTINKYEQFLVGLETDTQAVVTFEYDSELYNIQLVTIGNSPVINNPTSTDYVVFNGWLLDGESVDVSTYVVTGNVKFVADVTYKYDVVFNDGTSNVDSQIVTSGSYATEPTEPTKVGYTFGGWSLDGVNPVTVSTTPIMENTTYIAMWQINSYVVQFDDGANIVNTQSVIYGGYATEPATPTKTGYLFKGWSINGTDIVTIASTVITANTTFVALWDKTYTVTYYNEDNATVYDTDTIVSGNALVDVLYTPTSQNTKFAGWSLDKRNIIASDYTVTSDIALYPIVCDVFTGVWTYSNYTLTIYSNGAMTLSPSVPSFWFAEATRTLHISNGDDMEMELAYDVETNTLRDGSYVWTNTTNYITGDDVSIEAGRYETEDGRCWVDVSVTGELSHSGFGSFTSYTYGPSKYVVIDNKIIGNGIGFTFVSINETTITIHYTEFLTSYDYTLTKVS